MTTSTPARGGLSRVFLTEGGARPDHEPSYEGCMAAGAPEQTFGDITRTECPSPTAYDGYDVVGEYQGATENATISLTGHYALDLVSEMLRMARKRCPIDVQVHFGQCSDPSDFDDFQKAMIFEVARFTNWSADELGALESGDNTNINETADISARLMYEVVPITVTEEAASVVTNPINDVIIPSRRECGECDDEDDGCAVVMAVTASSPGSPGTASDLIWTKNSGVTFYADDISSLDASENADALAQVGRYIVVVSNDDGGIHYKLRSTVLAGTAFNWTRVATGIVASGEPNDIWSVGTKAFIVGDAGYIYKCTNPSAGVTVLDAGNATAQNLNAVHALNKKFAVAVGASGTIVQTTNGEAWGSVTGPSGESDALEAVWIQHKNWWFIGDENGQVYYTVDGGASWAEVTNLPVTLTTVKDIFFHNQSVGYIVGDISGPAGVILRTYNGGYSWRVVPEGSLSLPTCDTVNAGAACIYNENFMAAGGLGGDAADGIMLIGQQ